MGHILHVGVDDKATEQPKIRLLFYYRPAPLVNQKILPLVLEIPSLLLYAKQATARFTQTTGRGT
jgi:hypothetical protein